MRKLITTDVFKMARIIKEVKTKDAIAEIFKKKNKIQESDGAVEDKQEEAGFEAIMTVVEACTTEKAEGMLYDLLGGITQKGPDGVANQTLDATIEDIKTIVAENNVFNFFKQAGQLTN